MNKKIVALIPARLQATRFPEKLLQLLDNKTIITRTYESVVNAGIFDDVIVVCDDEKIKNEIEKNNGKAVLSQQQYESGTDRIAEIAEKIDADIIVNVQGDEPFISKVALQKVVNLFHNEAVEIASLKQEIKDKHQIENPNCVKVVCDKKNRALYFSRAAIPYVRDHTIPIKFYKHIGVYAFTKNALLAFTKLQLSDLEKVEKLENLRMLENGFDIYLDEIDEVGISIDTPEDFEKAKQYLAIK